jgi:Cu/Ag efflux protein CusF
MKKNVLALLVLAALPLAAFAQKPITEKESVTIKTTIDSIDHDSRLITFKDKDGNYETIYAGPEVKRFDELKVGDKVTFKYTESIAYQIRKAGEPAQPSSQGDAAIVRNPTTKPSGSMTQQETATVTVKAVDLKAPAITVQTEDGRSVSFKIKDKGKLKDVKPGDKVVITYTSALLISVD